MLKRLLNTAIAALLCASSLLAQPTTQPAAPAETPTVEVTAMTVKGRIEGENITFTIDVTAKALPKVKAPALTLITGDLVLDETAGSPSGARVTYDPAARAYRAAWTQTPNGECKVTASFAARPRVVEQGAWREVEFGVPTSWLRQLEVACDRTDLEVQFPGAMRLERKTENEKLRITAIAGPGKPFVVRWKPRIEDLDAKLVVATQANTILTASTGVLRVDTLFVCDISQGKMKDLSFAVPEGLSVTQVRGAGIRDWQIAKNEKDGQILRVVLSQEQTQQYPIQVLAETPLPRFPAEIAAPVLIPTGGIRASGSVTVGTDSAIQLVVKQTSGLSQIEPAAFPRIMLQREAARTIPSGKAFFYTFAASPYQLKLALDDMVPAFDASHRAVVTIKEDDLTLDAEFELDVREAPIRVALIDAPAGMSVASVTGPNVEDFTVRAAEKSDKPGPQEVTVRFKQPVIGRTIVSMRMELGKGPLDKPQIITGPTVRGSKNERGYVVLAAENGVQIDSAKPTNLREVHTGSVPLRVVDAQLAYRFREAGWTLELNAKKKPASIRVEAFHLLSLGDGVAYGMVAVNYFITGSPVDELTLLVPQEFANVEFVGRDVRQGTRDPKDPRKWTVKLQRKIIGDYNLGLTYNQPWGDGKQLLIGGVECPGVSTQTGFITLASHLNLGLKPDTQPSVNLLEIDRDELPANYRLLVNAPILKTFKYVASPHQTAMTVSAYARGTTLPVVIEVMQLDTALSVRENSDAESVTKARYKVKNSAAQFLTLTLPKDAMVWATRYVTTDAAGKETTQRVAASHDKATGELLIPLPRKRNPNDPTTLELEYGLVHNGGATGTPIDFAAPASGQKATFESWTIRVVGATHAVWPTSGGTMTAEERAIQWGDLSRVLPRVFDAWGRGIRRAARDVEHEAVGIAVTTAVGFVAWLFILARWRRAAAAIVVVVIFGAITFVGILAVDAGDFGWASHDDLSAVNFTEPVGLSDAGPMSVSVRVVPAWKAYADVWGVWVLPIAGAALLAVAAAFRRVRPLAGSLGLAACFVAAAQFTIGGVVVAHLLTWAFPLLAAVALLRLIASRPPRTKQAPATPPPTVAPSRGPNPSTAAGILLFAATLLGSGCAGTPVVNAAPAAPVVERVECRLAAEKDSMAVNLSLKLIAAAPTQIPIMDSGAILLSQPKISDVLQMVNEDGRYMLKILKAGNYTAELKFLSPLAAENSQQSRAFKMGLPMATANRVELSIPQADQQISAPSSVRFTRSEQPSGSSAAAIFAPGQPLEFTWKPRVRKMMLEQTVFYADLITLWTCDAGFVEGRHQVEFQIAQGELKEIDIVVPDSATVTGVEGADLGAWRFDPASRVLEARLSKGVSGAYKLVITTQLAGGKMPYKAAVAPLVIKKAARQRGTMGLASASAVHVAVGDHPQAINVDDFVRNSAKPAATAPAVRQAWRADGPADKLTFEVFEIKPEIRTAENAVFTVADDRLVYNAQFVIEIAKAGVFSTDLRLPDGFDIDTLTAAEFSHWDETTTGGNRLVQIHFNKKVLGAVTMNLSLSKAVSELPKQIAVPRVEAVGSVKHSGQIVISSDRGVRLSIGDRGGVSEVNPLELNIRTQGAMAFRLLGPDWKLALQTEVIEPRINVEFMHVAKVSEGLVRHTHYIRYRLFHAGAKTFEVQVPKDVLGLTFAGPDIVRREELAPGRWRLELGSKWFDRPYPLTIRYESRFDATKGELTLAPAKALTADLQRGYVVVQAGDRIALEAGTTSASLRPVDARNLPADFGAGDLSSAAYCFGSSGADYQLALKAQRHESVALLEAEAQQTTVDTVMTAQGQSINHIAMRLRVGGKRHLETKLPPGSEVWSLAVNGRSVTPSLRDDAASKSRVVLVPLSQVADSQLPVDVDLVYVTTYPTGLRAAATPYTGPRFDLPLKEVRWRMFLPPGMKYDHFDGGTLKINDAQIAQPVFRAYDVGVYENEVRQTAARSRELALTQIKRSTEYAQQGRQTDAWRENADAVANSGGDPALNEDMRVQLHRLTKQQALVGSRSRLRQQVGQSDGAQQAMPELGDQFTQAEAQRLQSSLNKADSENLEQITDRMIQVQETAAGETVQLAVNMPLRGRVLEFTRALQVKPDTEMTVSFSAAPRRMDDRWTLAWAVGLFASLLGAFMLVRMVSGRGTTE